jgi:hypothetical protein
MVRSIKKNNFHYAVNGVEERGRGGRNRVKNKSSGHPKEQ